MENAVKLSDLLLSLKNISYSAFTIEAKGVNVLVKLTTHQGIITYRLANYLSGQELSELTHGLSKYKA